MSPRPGITRRYIRRLVDLAFLSPQLLRHMIKHAIWRAMRAPFLVLATLVPSLALGATLPLEDGEYTRGRCEGGSADITESISLHTILEGAQKGRRFLSPDGEGQGGVCYLEKIDDSGAQFSGSAKCRSGTKIDTSEGTYRFTYEVLNNRTFVSKGRKYVWCAPHR
jgi:hypothetical protein